MNLVTKFLLSVFITFALMFAGCDDDTTNIYTKECVDELVWVGRADTTPRCVQIWCQDLDRFLEDGWAQYYDELTCKADMNRDDEQDD